jgi:predicted permease
MAVSAFDLFRIGIGPGSLQIVGHIPALVVGVLWLADAAPDTTTRVSVIEAAMPPMIGAGIVAAQANLAPRLVSLMVGVGIPLGLVTASGWHWLFGWLAA